MVSIKSLLTILRTTRNFWITLTLRKSSEKKEIIFRNGCKLKLTWYEYTIVRDILAKGYTVEPFDNALLFKKGDMKIVGPIPLVSVLLEDLEEIYSVDCRNKIVLDVGGFIGETAVFFSAKGAKKVIIYEPVLPHHQYIKTNLALNNVNGERHEEGLGETDGQTNVYYENMDECFGLVNKGPKELTIKTKSARRIIEESGADLAKFDCEGAEANLASIPQEVLRRIGFYIIEVHTTEIKNMIVDKFQRSGFSLLKDVPNVSNKDVSMVFFQRN